MREGNSYMKLRWILIVGMIPLAILTGRHIPTREVWEIDLAAMFGIAAVTALILAATLPPWLERRDDRLKRIKMQRDAARIKMTLESKQILLLLFKFVHDTAEDEEPSATVYLAWLTDYFAFVDKHNDDSVWREYIDKGTLPPGPHADLVREQEAVVGKAIRSTTLLDRSHF